MIGAAFGAANALLSLVRAVYEQFFSASARLRKWELWAAEGKARAASERDRQKATEDRIDKEPLKSGQELIDDLNRKSGDADK